MNGWGTWLSAGGVIAGLAGLAAVDAKRLRVSWVFLGLLVASAAVWRVSGHWPAAEGLLQGLVGCALGGAVAAVPMVWSEWRGCRTLLSGGDGLLLGAIGFLLGPIALSWAMALGGFAAACAPVLPAAAAGKAASAGIRGVCAGDGCGCCLRFCGGQCGIDRGRGCMAVNVNEVGRDSWERRKVASSLFRSAIVVGLAVAVAGLAVHPLWLGLAYLVSLAIGLDCGKRSKTGQRTRVVRLLAWLLGRGDLRPGIAVALAMGGVAIVAGMMIGHSEGCVERSDRFHPLVPPAEM